MDKGVYVVTEFATACMEDMVDVQDLECNAITPLPHSNSSTTSTIASAVDMTSIMKDITVNGICTD